MFSRRKKSLLWLVALIVVAIAVGTAFTAANTFDPNVGTDLGYGEVTVSGVTVISMDYTVSDDGTLVDQVVFKADGDITNGVTVEHGYVGFTVGGNEGDVVDCGTGVYTAAPSDWTTFTCDTTSLAQRIDTIEKTNIAIAN
jgi:hypothetical protein